MSLALVARNEGRTYVDIMMERSLGGNGPVTQPTVSRPKSCHTTKYDHGVQRSSFRSMNCSVGQCLEVVGEWWSLLIVRDAMLGVSRFDDFQARLGIARNVLALRLTRLVDEGVLERKQYSDHPPRFDYVLTAQGRDLWPVVNAMRQWGDRWRAPQGPPLQLVHVTCGHEAAAREVCSHCRKPIGPDNITAGPGPGDRGDFQLLASSQAERT